MASRRLLPVREHDTINAPGWQYTLLTGSSPIQQGRYKSGKGWPWSGALKETKITSFPAVIVSPSSWHCPK